MITRESIATDFQALQENICSSLQKADIHAVFITDEWERPGGGGGLSRILTGGGIIEKGGVNFSAVHGETPAQILKALNIPDGRFFATGVSVVIHPINPLVPIIHMNVRYFEMESGEWWFGGGIDLTPHYINEQEAGWFHSEIKQVCDQFDLSWYEKFKTWADDYFFLKHRNETRGIGGIFYDRLTGKKEDLLRFSMELGRKFSTLYPVLMNRNAHRKYGDREKRWQGLRRGRYVEFNLVWDKGTKFGLDTEGRTESILMSLPPMAAWEYDQQLVEASPEAATQQLLKKNINWITKYDGAIA